MAYDSYKLAHSFSSNFQNKIMYDKKKQVDYLYNIAPDREEGCTLNGIAFTKLPRIFDRKVKTNYYQNLTCETVDEIDRFKSGDLLFYDDNYWICTSSFIFHNLYCRGNFIRTNYELKWQKKNGDIIAQRCFVVSASQYNSGEKENTVLTLANDQCVVVLASNDDTLELENGKRIFISKSKNNPAPYKLTRNDTVPYSDWDDGCVNLVFTRDELNKDVDRQDLLLCDYISPTPIPTPTTDTIATISGRTTLNIGYARTYSVSFKDTDGNILSNIVYSWNLSSSFNDKITSTETDGKIILTINDQTLVGQTFKLQVIVDGNVLSEITIKVSQSLY
jgi:hypothetical protein